jgi:hypothetical protein
MGEKLAQNAVDSYRLPREGSWSTARSYTTDTPAPEEALALLTPCRCGQAPCTLRTELVVDALEMALWRRNPDVGLIHHTDQGAQYTALSFGKRLEDALGSLLRWAGRARR